MSENTKIKKNTSRQPCILLALTALAFIAFAYFFIYFNLALHILSLVLLCALTFLFFVKLIPFTREGYDKKKTLTKALIPTAVAVITLEVTSWLLKIKFGIPTGFSVLVGTAPYWVTVLVAGLVFVCKSGIKKGAKALLCIVLVLSLLCSSGINAVLAMHIDFSDTKTAYIEKVGQVSYENTFETAVPQTQIHDIVENFLKSDLPAGKTQKKVIVIGYDGCRADMLSLAKDAKTSALLRNSSGDGQLVLSYCGGVNYPAKNTQATSTAPGWCSMLTGEWADVHGITDNYQPKSNDCLTVLTTSVQDGIADSSAFYVSWDGHFKDEDFAESDLKADLATYTNEREYVKEKNLPVNFKRSADDDGTLNLILTDLAKDDCSDFIFTILEYCDHTGHESGFSTNNPLYREAFAQAENSALTVLNAIENRPTYESEDWLILMTADHGGYGSNHGFASIQERYTYISANRKCIDIPA